MRQDPHKLRALADAIEAHEQKLHDLFVRGRLGEPVTAADRAELQRLQREREAALRAVR